MKKIFFSIVAIAALAACTKSEVSYEPTGEIGFMAVAGNITKAPVDGTVFPTELNMKVYAQTVGNTKATPDYFKDALFVNKSDKKVGEVEVWGGDPAQYWPNVTNLHFAGHSVAGTYTSSMYDTSVTPELLKITGYNPGYVAAEGANDLMWFPTTELKTPAGYGKSTQYVPVDMYHTCAWITFLVVGDDVTGRTRPYTIKSLQMTGIDQTADVQCSATIVDGKIVPSIQWKNNGDKTDDTTPANVQYNVTIPGTGVQLSKAAKNVETGVADNTETNDVNEAYLAGNIVVIPQTPGNITITYSYTSPADEPITEVVPKADQPALSLKISDDPDDNFWQPGVHYIYTINIGAEEILIAPKPVDWTDDSNHGVTVE